MSIQIEAPDGSIAEFPDGTPDGEITRVMQQTFGGPDVAKAPVADPAGVQATAPQTAAPRSSVEQMYDAVMGVGTQFARGARTGLAAVAGLPVDAVNNAPRLANLIPGVDGVGPISDKPFLGSQYNDEALGGFGLLPEAPAPNGFIERGARRVGQEIGGAVVPVGGALAAAGRLGVQGARELGPLARTFVEPAAIAPGKFAAKEAVVATGAGQGAAIANELVDPNTTGGQWADILGAIFGAGATGVAGTVGGGLKNVVDAVRQNPNYADQIVRDAVVDRVGKAANLPGSETPGGTFDVDPLVQAIDSGRTKPSDVIPGYSDTLADRTGNPGLAAMEYGRQSGEGAGQFAQRRSTNTEAVDTAMRAIEPQATPGALRTELEAERGTQLGAAAQATGSAQQRFDAAAARLEPSMSGEGRGSVVRDALEEAKAAARDIEREAYPSLAGVQADVAPLARSMNDYIGGLSRAEREAFVPSQAGIPDDIVRAVTGDGQDPSSVVAPTSMNEVTGLRSVLNARMREASAGQRVDEARVIGGLLQRIDGFLDEALPGELRVQDARAREISRALNDTFTRRGTPVAGVLKRGENAQTYPTTNDTVAPRFVRGDEQNASALRDVRSTVGGFESTNARLPEVDAALQDQVRADINRIRDKPDQLARYATENSQVLDTYPELRAQIDEAVGAGRGAKTAGETEKALQSDIGTDTQPGRGTVGRYLQYSDANAERAISEVLAAKDPGKAADDLMNFVKDKPEAVEGARAAFWQKLKSESQSTDNAQRSGSGTRAWRGDWLKSWMDKPATQAVMERLYRDNPGHLDTLRKYADVLDNADLRVRGKAMGTSGTSQGVSNILTPETLQSRTYAYMRGQVSGTYLATSIAAVIARRAVRGARANAIERMTDKALLDPDFARDLLKDNNPANRAALARKAKAYLGNEASTFVNLMNEDEDDDETTNIIGEGEPLKITVRPNGQ